MVASRTGNRVYVHFSLCLKPLCQLCSRVLFLFANASIANALCPVMTFQPKLSVCHVGKLSLPDYNVLITDASGSIKENQPQFYCNVVFVSDITHLFR